MGRCYLRAFDLQGETAEVSGAVAASPITTVQFYCSSKALLELNVVTGESCKQRSTVSCNHSVESASLLEAAVSYGIWVGNGLGICCSEIPYLRLPK